MEVTLPVISAATNHRAGGVLRNDFTNNPLVIDAAGCDSPPEARSLLNYSEVLLGQIDYQRISLRELATRSGICKSRLGLLLHRKRQERSAPSLAEFHKILQALGLSMFEVVVRAEALDPDKWHDHRFSAAIAMLARLFHNLPGRMLSALDDLEGMDGTEVRPDWSIALERAVVKRVVQEVQAIAARRAAPLDFSF